MKILVDILSSQIDLNRSIRQNESLLYNMKQAYSTLVKAENSKIQDDIDVARIEFDLANTKYQKHWKKVQIDEKKLKELRKKLENKVSFN